MQKYKLFEHPETNEFDCGGMWSNDDGEYVLHSEAQARIAELERQLADEKALGDRLKAALREIYGNGDATGRNPQFMCEIAKEALK